MCVVFYKKPELHIATEDIEVVKLCWWTKKTWRPFRGNCLKTYSRCRYKVYIIGKTYRNYLDEPEERYIRHVWVSKRGLYSYSPDKVKDKVDNCNVFKGIIPKGSRYYYEPINGIYISNSLKLIK